MGSKVYLVNIYRVRRRKKPAQKISMRSAEKKYCFFLRRAPNLSFQKNDLGAENAVKNQKFRVASLVFWPLFRDYGKFGVTF